MPNKSSPDLTQRARVRLRTAFRGGAGTVAETFAGRSTAAISPRASTSDQQRSHGAVQLHAHGVHERNLGVARTIFGARRTTTVNDNIWRMTENGPLGRRFSESRLQLHWLDNASRRSSKRRQFACSTLTSGGAQRAGGRRSLDFGRDDPTTSAARTRCERESSSKAGTIGPTTRATISGRSHSRALDYERDGPRRTRASRRSAGAYQPQLGAYPGRLSSVRSLG